MDKLKELIEKELEKNGAKSINVQNIDYLNKLVNIHKNLSELKEDKEESEMRYRGYSEGSYGRRMRDSRGRYMEGDYSEGRGNYGHYMPYPEMYMERMMDGMEGYMEGREQYNRGNYGGKGQSIESLEKMLDGIVAFVEDILQDPEQKEEKEVVRHYLKKFKEM